MKHIMLFAGFMAKKEFKSLLYYFLNKKITNKKFQYIEMKHMLFAGLHDKIQKTSLLFFKINKIYK